ncbi:DUF4231 domain-containing protein [Sulfurovum sp.]|uniref:DUF4231 domain-containing protein n=1 Tax=Sulfurovum sp. TaxID=1969726 RepID=UPI0025F2FAF1|nr:DUF4231 domain-containing protein [Sulfurovum sp.]
MNEEQYFSERLDDQIKWYSSKSSYNQKMYKRLGLLEIISASFIPLLSGLSSMISYSEWIIGILGVIIAVSAGAGALYKFHENWMEYRTTLEALKHEKLLYLTQTVPYDNDERFQTLVSRAESIMANENQNWLAYSKKVEEEKK